MPMDRREFVAHGVLDCFAAVIALFLKGMWDHFSRVKHELSIGFEYEHYQPHPGLLVKVHIKNTGNQPEHNTLSQLAFYGDANLDVSHGFTNANPSVLASQVKVARQDGVVSSGSGSAFFAVIDRLGQGDEVIIGFDTTGIPTYITANAESNDGAKGDQHITPS